MWDFYNEPGNEGLMMDALPLLEKVFAWGREVDPVQPLTVGTWDHGNAHFEALNTYALEHSDIISFHNYGGPEFLEATISRLETYGRPLYCTEYMARTRGSRFETHLPIFKRHKVACYNWGLVSGKTQTIYPWDSPQGGSEPTEWFHDIFRSDGSPYCEAEVKSIREHTSGL